MKITRIRVWKENLKLTRPYTIAYETVDHVENIFVSLDGENGLSGIGAASPAPEVTGEDIPACETALAGLAPLLENRDLRDYNTLLATLATRLSGTPAAMAAADIALHDLLARSLDLPLVRLLGRVHDSLPTSITIGIMPVDETLEEAREYVGRGFTILKIKTGLAVEEDIERVIRVNETFGPGIRIRVDANQGYSPGDFRRFFKAAAHCVEFSEQPLPADEVAGMQALPEPMRQAAAADESLHSPEDVPRLLQSPRPFGIFNIKLMKCGGIGPGMEIAKMARHGGIHLMWGCMDESIVSISAALHAALASPATRYLDLDGSLDLARDIVDGGFILENGRLRTTDQPGLGVKRI